MTATRMMRAISAGILCAILCMAVFAGAITHYSYAAQFRELPNAGPSSAHILGTDSLGRDLFTRLIYGTRVSLLLAPAAALLSTLIAGLLGSIAGLTGSAAARQAGLHGGKSVRVAKRSVRDLLEQLKQREFC